MPAPHTSKQFSVGVYDKKHLRNLSVRLRKVQALLDEAAAQAATIGRRTGFKDEGKDFHFDDFPQARREIDTLLGELASGLSVNVREGISEAWGVSNEKNDAMVDGMLGSAGAELPKKVTRRWYNHNERAMNAFIRRREEGMGLSENVWNLAQFKEELELALESGLVKGVSAVELSRDVRSCLRHPDKLFRRVRDERGVLRLSRAAQAYHPGRGVYRSSYKNALRLTATETNIAYRSSDSRRWQQIDFVLSQHIEPSRTNHPVVDICDDLKGDYPKDFLFTGWHPFCRCFAVPKLASRDQFIKYQQALLKGEDVSGWKFDGEVKDVPEGFKVWVRENKERISRAKSQPYFLKDNPKYVSAAKNATIRQTIQDIEKSYVQVMCRDEKYLKEGIARKFDFVGVKNEIVRMAKARGINIGYSQASIPSDARFGFSLSGTKKFELSRTFTSFSEGIEVHHDLFTIDKSLQGKGFSKELFRLLYEQYKRVGVRFITVDANIDVGGYTWARYGFKATSYLEAIGAVGNARNKEAADKAVSFIKNWYKKNSPSLAGPFPMRLLTEKPWGKEVLLGSDWSGIIDLSDEGSRLVFEKYLGV